MQNLNQRSPNCDSPDIMVELQLNGMPLKEGTIDWMDPPTWEELHRAENKGAASQQDFLSQPVYPDGRIEQEVASADLLAQDQAMLMGVLAAPLVGGVAAPQQDLLQSLMMHNMLNGSSDSTLTTSLDLGAAWHAGPAQKPPLGVGMPDVSFLAAPLPFQQAPAQYLIPSASMVTSPRSVQTQQVALRCACCKQSCSVHIRRDMCGDCSQNKLKKLQGDQKFVKCNLCDLPMLGGEVFDRHCSQSHKGMDPALLRGEVTCDAGRKCGSCGLFRPKGFYPGVMGAGPCGLPRCQHPPKSKGKKRVATDPGATSEAAVMQVATAAVAAAAVPAPSIPQAMAVLESAFQDLKRRCLSGNQQPTELTVGLLNEIVGKLWQCNAQMQAQAELQLQVAAAPPQE